MLRFTTILTVVNLTYLFIVLLEISLVLLSMLEEFLFVYQLCFTNLLLENLMI